MGLDMYAYTASRSGQYRDWWQDADLDPNTQKFENVKLTRPVEIAYWRKHPNLHGWMEQLWQQRQDLVEPTDTHMCPEPHSNMFNGIELELTWQNIDQLEQCVLNNSLPHSQGFWVGGVKCDYFREQDLEFVRQARTNLFLGLRVFYNSSW